MGDPICTISSKVKKASLLMARWAGKEVIILPETKQYIPLLKDFSFSVVLTGKPGGSLVVCSRFLEPSSPEAEEIFNSLEFPK